jgi:hypothetical protein
MPKLSIQGFNGIVPRTSPTMLGDAQATIASDVNLYAGELRTWGSPQLAFQPANGAPIYTMRKVYNNAGLSTWLTWTGAIDLVLGPIADTTEIRMYYTDSLTPRKTNFAMATGGSPPFPSTWLNMGVPNPAAAADVGIVAGSYPVADTRAYVYTYVSTFGTVSEESGPSPATGLLTIAAGNGVNIFGFSPAPLSHYNITAIRIYRTISGTSTGASYAFVDQMPVNPATGLVYPSATTANGVVYSNSTLTDNLLSTGLGEALTTTTWAPPPVGLTGIVSMPNGMLAGFVGNTVYFSEPFFPHAWPLIYAQTVNDNIVGLGVFGYSLVACTAKFPYILSGTDPSSISVETVPLAEPCVSKRSIVSDNTGNNNGAGGVTYASNNGLVTIGPSTRSVVTHGLFRGLEWQALNPSTLISATYDGRYVSFYNNGTQAAIVMSSDDIPALAIKATAATASFVDPNTGFLYYANPADNNLYQLDANTGSPTPYTWQSKRFIMEHGETWSALKVDADYSTGGAVTVTLYGDLGTQQTVLTVASLDPVRIPPFRARELMVKVSAVINVRSLAMATSVMELR